MALISDRLMAMAVVRLITSCFSRFSDEIVERKKIEQKIMALKTKIE